jgi:GWxTD domain-containing protein
MQVIDIKKSLLKYCFLLPFICFDLAVAQKTLDLSVNYARFYGGNNLTFVEIYYGINRNSLEHIVYEEGYIAKYRIKLDVVFKDSVIKSVEWDNIDKVATLDKIGKNQMINDVHQLILGEGSFKIHLNVTDLNSHINDKQIIDLNTKLLKEQSIYISDVQLALNIEKSEKKSRFNKNGFMITPNPSAMYNENWSILYYYCEIYTGSDASKNDNDIECIIISEIRNSAGKTVLNLPHKNTKIKGSGIVETNKISIQTLNSDEYLLSVVVKDSFNNIYDKKTATFKIHRLLEFMNMSVITETKYDEFDAIFKASGEADLNQEFDWVSYIADNRDKEIFEELDLEGKKKYLKEFWNRKSKHAQDRMKYRLDYLEKVKYANNRFSTASKEGWKSDRGRILILYGIPDDMERMMDVKQHEIWAYYNIENGVEFIFMDITGYGVYRLVHSTMHNEIKDYNWRNRYLNK